MERVREWVAREVVETFALSPEDAARIAASVTEPHPTAWSEDDTWNQAMRGVWLVTLCRLVRSVPGVRDVVEAAIGVEDLRDVNHVLQATAEVNERWAPPAVGDADGNWPSEYFPSRVRVPAGAAAGDMLMYGDGEGNRLVMRVAASGDAVEPQLYEFVQPPFSTWETQAKQEAESLLRADGIDRPTYDRRGPIRQATPDDVPAILSLIRELAAYERSPESAVATEEGLRAALFGASPAAFCHVAEVDGEVVGFALWFLNFSTWLGRHGLYLEDLFVRPSHRGQGLGKALLETLVGIARERGYGRVEWVVLDWNEPAHAFYRSMGAVPMDDWTVWRIET